MEHLDGIEAVMFSHKFITFNKINCAKKLISLEVFFTGSIDGHLRIFDTGKLTLKDDIVLDVIYFLSQIIKLNK